jgi:UDP-N-acetylmuramoyl-tripeptide--D-alanyl-D-alanine ligase
MKVISIALAAKWIGAVMQGDASGQICAVSTDSRTVGKGECFFAVKGEKFDGHDHVAAAIAKGAACAVVSKEWRGQADGCLLRVDDTILALGEMAREYRRTLATKVVGITGSAGKTTSREMIHHVLSTKLKVFRSPKSFNNNIGVPLTIFSACGDEDVLVVEMGTNHPGEIAYLTRIAQPDIAIITNVYPAHLEGFGSIGGIVKEKCSIAEGLTRGGKLIIYGAMPALVGHCKAKGYNFTTFGRAAGCDIRCSDVKINGQTSSFVIDGVRVELPVPGEGNVENATGAWAIARELGFTAAEFAVAIKTMKPADMRMEVLKLGRATVICDCYNANPGSMNNALGVLSAMAKDGERKVFICGPMRELGTMSEELHTELGRQIAAAEVDLLLTAGEMKATAEAARAGAKEGFCAVSFTDTQELANKLREFVKIDDIILVKGSRASRLEAAVEQLKRILA